MDLQIVEQIVALLNEYPVSEITVEQNGQRVSVRSAPAPAHALAEQVLVPIEEISEPLAVLRVESSDALETSLALTAPLVGIFHFAVPPVRHGALVKTGQVVGNIESMKLMTEVLADSGGRIIEVLVEDGSPVEYGQALFRLAAI